MECRRYAELEQPMPHRTAGFLRTPVCLVAYTTDLVTEEPQMVPCAEMRGDRQVKGWPVCGPEYRAPATWTGSTIG